MVLETARLLLREMAEDDFVGLCRMLQDSAVMYAYEHAFSDEEAHTWLQNQLRRYREDGFGLWAVILRETGEMIGQCGLTLQGWGGKSVPEVGYLFEKAAWHQGYGVEAAIACKRYAFDVLNMPAVYSIIRDTNEASIAVAKRNGMTAKGHIVKHYYATDMPHTVFGVSREEDAAQK